MILNRGLADIQKLGEDLIATMKKWIWKIVTRGFHQEAEEAQEELEACQAQEEEEVVIYGWVEVDQE